MLVYREKDNLIHKLHPFTIVFFIAVIFILSLVFSHPVYLLGLFIGVSAVIIASGNFSEWKIYLKMSVFFMLMIMFINTIVVQTGDTVLLTGPRVPVFGRINVTLEALAFGAGMGLRLLVIISVFCLYTYAVHPDKVLKMFSRLGNKSVLLVALSTRLFPLMVSDYKRITEVQKCRGVKFDTGKRLERVKNFMPVISILLLSSLERSMQIAESMNARGFGTGKRSSYSRNFWRPRDIIIIAALSINLLFGILAAVKGWSAYNYYPKLTYFKISELYIVVIVVLTLIVPAVLNWGWKKWPLWKSKI
jgi:energy-coupling factor transport system permease protein